MKRNGDSKQQRALHGQTSAGRMTNPGNTCESIVIALDLASSLCEPEPEWSLISIFVERTAVLRMVPNLPLDTLLHILTDARRPAPHNSRGAFSAAAAVPETTATGPIRH